MFTLHHATVKSLTARNLPIPTVNADDTWAWGDQTGAGKAELTECIALAMKDAAPAAPAAKAAKKKGGKAARAAKSGVKPPKRPEYSGMVKRVYKKAYEAKGGTCGDALAIALSEFCKVPAEGGKGVYTSVKHIHTVCAANGIETRDGYNPGHQLMILSNMLRGVLRRGERDFVKIGGTKIKADEV